MKRPSLTNRRVFHLASEAISVHFAEIALKGRNRPQFESALADNIRSQLGSGAKVSRAESRIIITPEGGMEDALKRLSRVFGIAWFSRSYITSKDMEEIIALVLGKALPLKGTRLRVEASRSDKSFPLKSPDINRAIGKALEGAGHSIDLNTPERRIYVEVLRESAVVSFGRSQGLGGLPVGASGKVLSLLSGGIDSPVASWLMMKRGCCVDFLHLHAGRSIDEARGSKMPKLVEALKQYHPQKCRLFVAPYDEFYKRSVAVDPRVELVVFRRFMLRLASAIAAQNGHLGLVTGDNIGQVASQTLENLLAANEAASLPVYRPLATYDKQEIISLAQKVGTYGLSIEDYKDCCSLVAAKHPSTKVKPDKARAIEEEIRMEEIVEKTLARVEVLEF
jgi:thiamine biosynthesis protein ThiI